MPFNLIRDKGREGRRGYTLPKPDEEAKELFQTVGYERSVDVDLFTFISTRELDLSAFLDELQGSQDPKLHVASSRPVIVRYRADTGNDCGGTDSWAPSRNLIGERPRPAASRSKEATCQPSSVSPW
jgi:hypothetical protein